jgi:hypothetical protein
MTDPGTTSLRAATGRVPAEFPYFWFLSNDPPLYDRFLHCIHHASDNELTQWGGYQNVPPDRVEFHQYIYSHFRDGLREWSNRRVDSCRSPSLISGARRQMADRVAQNQGRHRDTSEEGSASFDVKPGSLAGDTVTRLPGARDYMSLGGPDSALTDHGVVD